MDSAAVHGHKLVGSIAMWVGWWICAVFAGDKFMAAWWLDPKSRAEYTRAALDAPRLPHGAVPWQVVFRSHPSTISEMMGKTDTAQGAVAQALCLPGTLLCTIGGFMVYTYGNCFTSAVLSFCRASGPGIGLMMTIYTPLLTLMPDFVKTRVSSELEDCWWSQWIHVHMLGFICWFGSALLFELPTMIYRLWCWSAATQDLSAFARCASLVVTLCSVVSCILSILALVQMGKPAKNPDTASYKGFMAEYAALLGFACLYMLSACAVWVENTGENSWVDSILVASGIAYTLYKFTQGPVTIVSWLFQWDSLDFNEIVRKEINQNQLGEVMRGMIKLTDNDLYHVRICQAGQPFEGDDVSYGKQGAFGSKHPKVMQFLVRPCNYLTIAATDFHQMSREDLRRFNVDFALVLGQLKSAEIIHFPYGAKFKFERKIPFVRLSCKDYNSEVAHIDKKLKPNTLHDTHDKDTKFVAYNITDRVLEDERTAFLAATPLSKAIAEGDCFGLYEFFGTLLGDSTPPFTSFVTRPGIKVPDGLNYEIQVRGITAAPPTVILHVIAGQDMPKDWIEAPFDDKDDDEDPKTK